MNDVISEVEDLNEELDIQIAVRGRELVIDFDKPFSENMELSIYAMDGKLCIREVLAANTSRHRFSLDALSNGVYVLSFKNGQEVKSHRIQLLK
jgi:hypothetical protein